MNKQELLKQDDITVAVDKCNVILKELDLRIGTVIAISEADKPYSMYEGKLYTNKTLDKLK